MGQSLLPHVMLLFVGVVYCDLDNKTGCFISDIDNQQSLLEYQETLPLYLLQQLDINYDEMPVFTAAKLLQLYIGDDNVNANEVDFKKAFELTTYLHDRVS